MSRSILSLPARVASLTALLRAYSDFEDSKRPSRSHLILHYSNLKPTLQTTPADSEANLQAAAQVILAQIRTLADVPTNALSFPVADYGRGTHTPAGDAFVQTVFSGLHELRRGVNSTVHGEGPKLNVAFAEFSRIWDGVLGADPDHRFEE